MTSSKDARWPTFSPLSTMEYPSLLTIQSVEAAVLKTFRVNLVQLTFRDLFFLIQFCTSNNSRRKGLFHLLPEEDRPVCMFSPSDCIQGDGHGFVRCHIHSLHLPHSPKISCCTCSGSTEFKTIVHTKKPRHQ
uniref:Uncharacterized protein n=1 Tax=Cacopsylla melanoneura TaxID=428564 RepID=A0A8D8ZSU9_9HEMI